MAEPYDALPAIDPFAAARAFDCLTEELADPASAALTHRDPEDLIEARGRELLRLLLQAHLDLRERAEREQGKRAGRPAVRGADGQVRPHREVGRGPRGGAGR